MSILLVGLGHPDRGDDAVGSTVLWSLAAEGGVDADGPGDDVRILVLVDPVDLPLRWAGAEWVVVIDAVLTEAAPGTITVAELGESDPGEQIWSRLGLGGSHAFGLGEAVALSRALGRMPQRLTLVGVEAADVTAGAGLSPAVAEAVPRAVARIRDLVSRERIGAGDVPR